MRSAPRAPALPGGLDTAPVAPRRATVAGASLTRVNVIIAVIAAVALALRLYQLARPGYLLGVTEYDDGPYFGSAIRLVNGSIPYRDFLLVQPPGITLLMTPAALLGKVIGTDWAIAVGRLLTVCAGVACVVLAGVLVRHRGVIAVLVACGLTAVYPDSVQAAHTVLVEPWLAMFCLAGAIAVFHADRLTASRARLIWGGAAFGFAGAVEVWAIFPLAVLGVLMLRAPRNLIRYLAGAAAGFLIPVVPFAILSPRGFYRGLVVAQVGSRYHATRESNWYRLKEMAGLSDFHISHSSAWLGAILLAALVAMLVAGAWLVTRRLLTSLEWFAIGSAVLIVAAFMWPNQFHYHFVAFLAPFVGMAIGLPAARLLGNPGAPWPIQDLARGGMFPGVGAQPANAGVPMPAALDDGALDDGALIDGVPGDVALDDVAPAAGVTSSGAFAPADDVMPSGATVSSSGTVSFAAGNSGRGPGGRDAERWAPLWLQWGAVAVAVLALVYMTFVQARSETTLVPHIRYSTVVKIRQAIPPGACVVTDEVSMTITADRFVSTVPGCPLLVDSIGTDYALSHGLEPATGAAKVKILVAVWTSALAHAQYVWLSGRESHRVPWTPALTAYLAAHFTKIINSGGVSGVYRRDNLPAG